MGDTDTIDPKSFIEQILFSTLKIELLNNNDELQSIGTGFLLKADFPQEPSRSLILLISNRHVLDTSERFNITFHQRKADSNLPELGQTLSFRTANYREVLFLHPNPKIDLACVNISSVIVELGSKIYHKVLDRTLFANFNEPELDAGQRVIFIGYPENRYDQKHNLPVLRSGVTASHPKLNYNGEEQFLIDAQVFPGSSGSPVFLNMKEAQYNMGQIILGSGLPYLFVGVVSATMIRNNIVSPLPTKQLGISEEVIGLGLVFKATALNVLIDLALNQTWSKMHS
jgi:V8-like Glu-specific endopeptidase